MTEYSQGICWLLGIWYLLSDAKGIMICPISVTTFTFHNTISEIQGELWILLYVWKWSMGSELTWTKSAPEKCSLSRGISLCTSCQGNTHQDFWLSAWGCCHHHSRREHISSPSWDPILFVCSIRRFRVNGFPNPYPIFMFNGVWNSSKYRVGILCTNLHSKATLE